MRDGCCVVPAEAVAAKSCSARARIEYRRQMERRADRTSLAGAYSQAAEPRRGGAYGDWRGAATVVGNRKRLLTRAFRFAGNPCGMRKSVPLANLEPGSASEPPRYSRARRRIAAISPITSNAPTSPTTPFQPWPAQTWPPYEP